MVRRLVSYDRFQSPEALAQLNCLYPLVERYVNFFQPMMQLKEKYRQGTRVPKVYDVPKTPYRRLLDLGVLSETQQMRLVQRYRRTNPVKLL